MLFFFRKFRNSRRSTRLVALVFTCLAVIVTLIVGVVLTARDDPAPRLPNDPSQVDCRVQPLERIRPGTVIGDTPPSGWTHLLMKCHSRLTAGAIDELLAQAKPLSELLFTAMVARVSHRPGRSPPFRLESIAVGLGTTIDGKDTIITTETQEELGADFGFLARLVLDQGEKKLDGVLQVARSPTAMIVDTPSILSDKGKHREVILRHAFLLDPDNGGLANLVWRIDLDDRGQYAGVTGPVVHVKPNLVVTCPVHVDGGQIFGGVPLPTAFAVIGLPPGQEIPMPPALRAVAGRRELDVAAFAELEAALRRLIDW